jgi:hypothetical protein
MTDFCKGASLALATALRRGLPDGEWRIDGGWGSERMVFADDERVTHDAEWLNLASWPGGMQDEAGSWKGHYWVVGTFGDEEIVFDLTADQFGHDPVTITSTDDGRYRSNVLAERMDECLTDRERAWAASVSADWEIEHMPDTAFMNYIRSLKFG